jgi:ribosomal protein S12 methylthiotransferase
MKNRINIVTLGCSKNLVDSEKLLRQLSAGGFEVLHNSDETTGTVIINTCGFIRDAKEESIDTILNFVRAKERGEVENLYVMGCLAERHMHELKKEIPEVQKYFGVNNITEVLGEMGLKLRDDLLNQRMLTGPDHYAYLKISEGCDRTCSFCAIPMIRGKYTSRSIEDLVNESYNLAEAGVRELILIAQDLSYYGLDIYKRQALPELVSELLKIRSLDWIRLHYLYPANFPPELLRLVRDNEKICRYIDIPVQHISENMLRIMRRSHNAAETRNLLHKIRQELPGAAIRTTLITGHPGETEKDFEEMLNFVREFRFDRLGVFAYSHEDDTYSFKNYHDEIPDEVKVERMSELMDVQQQISSDLNSLKIGKTLRTIIDRKEGKYHIGRTEFDSPEVDQEVLIPVEYEVVPGRFYNIEITETSEFDLYGKPVPNSL